MDTDLETDRRVEAAKASFVAHAEELGRRIKDAKAKLNIPAKIAEHPLLAVGAALAIGALLGYVGGGARPKVVMRPATKTKSKLDEPEVKRSLLAAGGAALGTLAVQFAKDFAVRQLVTRAASWIDERDRAGISPTEAATSHMPETESFFRH